MIVKKSYLLKKQHLRLDSMAGNDNFFLVKKISSFVRGCLPILMLLLASHIVAFEPMNNIGCCAVSFAKNPVVNADQTVILLWDKEQQTQHFIRQANFKTNAQDIGFLVPSPSRPQLEESGNAAFAQLARITAPKPKPQIFIPFSCAASPAAISNEYRVTIIEEKRVAGFDATVLTAKNGDDLVQWLKDNGYSYSPAVADWAKPYLGGDWHFTALKIAKNKDAATPEELKATSLRISFRTDRPLFPYREPDSANSSNQLDAKNRLLRIYFIADTQYEGKINGETPWSGRAIWSGDITTHRNVLLTALQLPQNTGPAHWWLTKFEDAWPYEKAKGDLYFLPVSKKSTFGQSTINGTPSMDIAGIAILSACSWAFLAKFVKKFFPKKASNRCPE